MESNNSRKRGRPATGRAKDGSLFIRLPSGKKEEVKKVVEDYLRGRINQMSAVTPLVVEVTKPSPMNDSVNIRKLLDDNQRLEDELKEERAKVVRALELDLDEKGKLGWRLYFKLKGEKEKSEFDQE